MAKLDDLKVEADALGITYAPNIGEAGLTKKLEEFKKTQVEAQAPVIETPEAPAVESGRPPADEEDSEEESSIDGEEETPEPPVTKPALKPLGEVKAPVAEVEGPKWSGGSKICLGTNGSYPDDEEHFPLYKTPKGDKNCYSKDFLDKKVKSGFIKVKKGIYVAVDTSKKK